MLYFCYACNVATLLYFFNIHALCCEKLNNENHINLCSLVLEILTVDFVQILQPESMSDLPHQYSRGLL